MSKATHSTTHKATVEKMDTRKESTLQPKTETKKEESKEQPEPEVQAAQPQQRTFSEISIKEMMAMKNVDRDEALRLLQNPTPHETAEDRSARLLQEEQGK